MQIIFIHRSSAWKVVDQEVDTRRMETYILKCNSSFNFGANLPTHAPAKKKIQFWRKKIAKKRSSRPFNVIFLGIDTVSRSNAYRCIPKTLALLREMGFHDFQAFHSIAPSTLSNLMASLMGLKRTQAREVCTPNWESPFDPCPFIWKNYSSQNYVTMYIEDGGESSFNWGGQSGFHQKPTDYYINILFKAIEKCRLKDYPVNSFLVKVYHLEY